jgi:hypothetical protein
MPGEVCCEPALLADRWAMSGHRRDADLWTCPGCGSTYVHVCDEADGCAWLQVPSTSPEEKRQIAEAAAAWRKAVAHAP